MASITLCIGLLIVEEANANPFKQTGDTTVIEFTDKGVKKRITVLTSSDKKFNIPQVLNLDNILTEIGVDSNERKKAMVLVEKNGEEKDTILVVDRAGGMIKIVAKNPFPVNAETDTSRIEQTEKFGEREENKNSDEKATKEVILGKRNFFPKSDFGLYLGINGWNNTPQSPNQLNDLRRWKSRYLALSFRKNATLLNTEPVDIALSLGPEIAWYNFMLENDNKVEYSNNQVAFVDAKKNLSKSKLVMPYVNFPVLLNFGLEESKLKLGVGGYVGYRIGGYTKLKDNKGEKTKEQGNFGMNDLLYGLTAEVGRKNGFTLFIRYDLVDLFKANQLNAKELRAWSIGFRI